MTARSETYELMAQLGAHGLSMSFEDANTLRRAAITLHGWDEAECGNSDQWKSWSIERDEESGIPYMCLYFHDRNGVARRRIPDREAGALRRVAAICGKYGARFYHQSDPRGASLYIGAVPLTDTNYSSLGVAV